MYNSAMDAKTELSNFIISTYWNSKGSFPKLVEKLGALVPRTGSIPGNKNPALEKFRVAQNCYYDLYNNGLCNRKREFRNVFGFASTRYSVGGEFTLELYQKVEAGMDAIILAAGREQGLI